MTSALLNVTINNDNLLEENEKFMLKIVNSLLNNQGFIFTIGTYNKTTVTIIDTTGK